MLSQMHIADKDAIRARDPLLFFPFPAYSGTDTEDAWNDTESAMCASS